MSAAKFLMVKRQAKETEHISLGVVGFDQAIAVEEGAIAPSEHYLLLLVGHAGH